MNYGQCYHMSGIRKAAAETPSDRLTFFEMAFYWITPTIFPCALYFKKIGTTEP